MSLLHRMSLSSKFLVLGLIALVTLALPTTLYLQRTEADVDSARRHVEGAHAIVALQDVIRLLQNHRGLAAGALGARQSLSESTRGDVLAAQLPTTGEAIERAIAALDARFAEDGISPDLLAGWNERRRQWALLRGEIGDGKIKDAGTSTDRHTALIDSFLVLGDAMLDEFGLALSPERASNALVSESFVHAPWLAEMIGRMRATGTAALVQGYVSDATRAELVNDEQRVHERMSEVERSLAKAFAANASLQQELRPPLAALKEKIQRSMTTVEQRLTQALQVDLAGSEYYEELADTIGGVYELNRATMRSLVGLLEARADGLQRTEYVVAGLLALIVVLSLALSTAFVRSVTVPVREAVATARAIADGDLARTIEPRGDNEIGRLVQALAAMRGNLTRVVSDVRRHADAVAQASAQIAQGGNELSARTEQAAGALEETAASMEQLSATVRHNADNARQADELARGASEVARAGGGAVGEVVETMKGINDSAGKITDIVGVIDAIAFQTNILALNAAVEAARAGEQGRGFAVVAGEVRSLAQRSADAAREIKALIETSVERVEAGAKLVDRAGATMGEIVGSVRRVTDLVGDISSASDEQSTGVAQVGEAVAQLEKATQHNAALVEESAAAAALLQDQANELVRAVAVFRLDDGGLDAAGPERAVDVAPPHRHESGTPAPVAAGPKSGRIEVLEEMAA